MFFRVGAQHRKPISGQDHASKTVVENLAVGSGTLEMRSVSPGHRARVGGLPPGGRGLPPDDHASGARRAQNLRRVQLTMSAEFITEAARAGGRAGIATRHG
jgi:hypothetical protein